MLNAKIDLVPYGDESRRTEIVDIAIANDGTGSLGYGNYRISIRTDIDPDNPVVFRMERFDRRDGPVELLRQVLNHWRKITDENSMD